MPATLITTRAMVTSTSTAAISLALSGVLPGRTLTDRQRPRAQSRGAIGRSLRGRQPHDVANAAQGVQQVRLCRVDLAAQDGDIGLDDAGVAAEVVVPDV